MDKLKIVPTEKTRLYSGGVRGVKQIYIEHGFYSDSNRCIILNKGEDIIITLIRGSGSMIFDIVRVNVKKTRGCNGKLLVNINDLKKSGYKKWNLIRHGLTSSTYSLRSF